MACIALTDRLLHRTAPLYQKLLNASVWSWNEEIVLRAPQIMSVNGIGVGKQFSDIYSGTCLFTVSLEQMG